ncbi:ribonuclease Oy-like [Saccostrea echinata]|uniref:ribonuclease Oy-like n=1 Tax=Saccostrea echinata TaxID=191078 RepID=UPI002A7ED6BB|nr:ribonuclease Oy-like [Saccostrea echinata]
MLLEKRCRNAFHGEWTDLDGDNSVNSNILQRPKKRQSTLAKKLVIVIKQQKFEGKYLNKIDHQVEQQRRKETTKVCSRWGHINLRTKRICGNEMCRTNLKHAEISSQYPDGKGTFETKITMAEPKMSETSAQSTQRLRVFDLTMMPFIHFMLLIVIRLSSDNNHVIAVEFDFFILALQWPVTFCKIQNCSRDPPNNWTIHGLWPSNFTPPFVTDCKHNESFSEENIPEITISAMNEAWPDLKSKDENKKFWSHEWKKHGTCADVNGTRSLAEYFTKAVELAHSYSIYSFLEKSNITPNATTSYRVPVIVDGIIKETKANPHIIYTRIKDVKTSFWISEVRLCFNKTFSIIACKKNNGKNNVFYPPPSSQTAPSPVHGGKKNTCKN